MLGDGARAVALGDRDCSVQRRYQKLFEEAPAPLLPDAVRAEMAAAALALADAPALPRAGHRRAALRPRAGHLLLPGDERPHPGRAPGHRDGHRASTWSPSSSPSPRGCRCASGRRTSSSPGTRWSAGSTPRTGRTASDPSPGRIDRVVLPVGDGIRVDTHVQGGSVVPPYYDSLLAKLIVHGVDRADALARARAALDLLRIDGVTTTVPVHQALLADPEFAAGGVDTAFFERFLQTADPTWWGWPDGRRRTRRRLAARRQPEPVGRDRPAHRARRCRSRRCWSGSASARWTTAPAPRWACWCAPTGRTRGSCSGAPGG